MIDELTQATALIPDPSISRLNRTTELERLFAQSLPPPSAAPLLHPEVVSRIREAVRVALEKIEDSRKASLPGSPSGYQLTVPPIGRALKALR